MKMEFTVKRNRGSVTQGTATVLLNGVEVITFADEMTITDKNRGNDYGDIIGGWQSSKPDSAFIKGVLIPLFYKRGKNKKSHYANYRVRQK